MELKGSKRLLQAFFSKKNIFIRNFLILPQKLHPRYLL